MSHILATTLLSLVLLSTPALAKQTTAPSKPAAHKATSKDEVGEKVLGTFGKWQAYSSTTGGQKICYMALSQQFAKSKKFPRGSTHLMITHRPTEGSTDVVSYTAGYVYKPLADVTVQLGKNKFDLFTQKDTAWARDTKTDHEVTTALRANKTLLVTGTPETKGMQPITDKLDITGAADAYNAISQACGLKVDTPKKPTPETHKKTTPSQQKLAPKKKKHA